MQLTPPASKVRYPRALAIQVARLLTAELSRFCDRFIFAGSLRRGKRMVGDIEVLYIPKLIAVPDDLFTTRLHSIVDSAMEELIRRGILAKRRNVKGSEIWGEKNKLAVHCETGIPVDLFATTEGAWWNYLVVRTGGQRNNVLIAEAARRQNLRWNPYGEGFTSLSTGDQIPVRSEEDVYRIAGLAYIPPNRRP